MSDLVRHKRPAEVVRARPRPAVPQRVETIVGSKAAVLREVARLKQARALYDTGDLKEIRYGPEMGLYELRVLLTSPPAAPRWTKVCIGLGAFLLGVAALLGSLAWLLTALTVPALVGFLATVLVAFLAWLRMAYGRGRTRGVVVTVVTSTTVEVR